MSKENSGYLGRNERKEKPTHPDYSGALNVNGREYWLSAWVREKKDESGNVLKDESGKVKKYFSLAVRPKDGNQSSGASQTAQMPQVSDDMPF